MAMKQMYFFQQKYKQDNIASIKHRERNISIYIYLYIYICIYKKTHFNSSVNNVDTGDAHSPRSMRQFGHSFILD